MGLIQSEVGLACRRIRRASSGHNTSLKNMEKHDNNGSIKDDLKMRKNMSMASLGQYTSIHIRAFLVSARARQWHATKVKLSWPVECQASAPVHVDAVVSPTIENFETRTTPYKNLAPAVRGVACRAENFKSARLKTASWVQYD